MNTALMEGDFVVVNKLALGARIPITPLSIHIGNKKYFLDWIQIPYCRLPGYSAIKQNDIIVFNQPTENKYPVDERKESVKRCVGLPGDVVKINKGDVYINDKYKNEPEIVKWYSIQTNDNFKDTLTLKKLIHRFSNDGYIKNELSVFVSKKNMDSILRLKNVISCKTKFLPKNQYSPGFFPNASQIKWNPDNFGPLYIPKKGLVVVLNKNMLYLYQHIIEKYENNSVRFIKDSVFINSIYSKYYTFKMNYYFVLGDNRYNSIDSRFFGLVPEDHLIGKAQ